MVLGAFDERVADVTGGVRRAVGVSTLGAYRLGVRARAKALSLSVAGSFAEFGARTVIQPPIRVSGERRIALGNDVFIGSNSWLQALAHDDPEPAIRIGDGTSVAGQLVVSALGSIVLGQRVLVARNVYIADHAHEHGRFGVAILDQGLSEPAPVEIEDGAWLGQNVVVGPGVRVGRGAVVGANSVVLTDVPDRCLAVGAPARIVQELRPQRAARRAL